MRKLLLATAALAFVSFEAAATDSSSIQLAQAMSYQGCKRTMPGDSSPCPVENPQPAMSYQGCTRTMPGDSSPCEVKKQ